MILENNKYKKYFNLMLEQPEDAIEATPDQDQEALVQGLEAETDPAEFNVIPTQPDTQAKVVQKLNEYISKIEDFSDFLNNPERSDSLNRYINEIDKEGSVLKGISRETSKVTTVAENLASLGETFKSAILVASRKQREKQISTQEY